MRILGHPVHPILVCFPVALLALVPICDGAAWLGVAIELARVGYYLELFGLVGGALAAVPGFIDFFTLKAPAPKLNQTGILHATLAATTLSCFGIAFALRGPRDAAPAALVCVVELLGAATLAATGWFGGHLVFHFGLGVKRDASGPTTQPSKS
jgi:uncharacterized membrane protein